MKTSLFTLAILATALTSCNKIVEHDCVCRNFEGQIVETNTQYGSEDNAEDLCSQREQELNEQNPGQEIYTCVLD